jgi:hypothetical protein
LPRRQVDRRFTSERLAEVHEHASRCTSCSDINTGLSQPDAATSGSCTPGSTGECSCSITYRKTNAEQDTYTTSGTTLTTTPQGPASLTTWDYCVQGSTLRLHRVESSTTGSATFLIVATQK